MSTFTIEIETTCAGGFPIIAHAEIGFPEPDVGLPNYYIVQWEVLSRRGQPVPFIKPSKLDEVRIEDEILNRVAYEVGRSL